MALADTARLIASLELQDKFSATAQRFDRTLGGMERQTGTLGRIGDNIGRGTQNAIRGIATVGVFAGGAIAASVAVGIQSLAKLEEVNTATNTVIASTKGVAGQSAETIRRLAEEYESLNATMDDKVIQSGENLLLTFTNIRTQAFEPALEAALNLNEAMGGGEEGLQSTIIQVGKALNDPIKGVAQLRRVGVQLSREQEAQIKTLVEQNDLYGAQRVILDELTTQFGGRFAAAGDTATGKFARLKDTIEDAQMSLATAFLPVLEKASDKLSAFLGAEGTQDQLKEIGESLAAGLDDLIEIGGKLPWSSIGDSFRLVGQGAKAALDFFTGLPPWVQTAVLTGWGLNKLTGGALGGIVGELGKGLIKGVLGMNAGVVNINAATVNGGVPGVGGKGGGFGGSVLQGAKTGAALAAIPLAGIAAVEVIGFEEMRNEQKAGLQGILDELPRNQASLDKINDQINLDRPFLEGILFNTNVRPTLEAEAAEIQAAIDRSSATASSLTGTWTSEARTAYANIQSAIDRSSATASSLTGAWTSDARTAYANLTSAGFRTASATEITSRKDFSPKITVPVSVFSTVSIHNVARTTASARGAYAGPTIL